MLKATFHGHSCVSATDGEYNIIIDPFKRKFAKTIPANAIAAIFKKLSLFSFEIAR